MSEAVLAFEEQCKDVECQVCKMLPRTISMTGSYENAQENEIVGICFLNRNVASIRRALLRMTFYL